MSAAEKLVVTLTLGELRQLIRDEVQEAVIATSPKSLQPAVSLSVKEAAACLKIPDHMLRKRARNGEIGSFKVGSELRFDVADLEAFKQANRTPPKRKAG